MREDRSKRGKSVENEGGAAAESVVAGHGLLGLLISPLSAQEVKLRTALRGHTEPVWSVAFSSDGKTLASGSMDSTIRVWEVATGKEQSTFKGQAEGVYSVAYRPDGKTLTSGHQTTKQWDVATGKEKFSVKGRGFTGAVRSLAFSPDGKKLAWAHDHAIKLWDIATGKELATLAGRSNSVDS